MRLALFACLLASVWASAPSARGDDDEPGEIIITGSFDDVRFAPLGDKFWRDRIVAGNFVSSVKDLAEPHRFEVTIFASRGLYGDLNARKDAFRARLNAHVARRTGTTIEVDSGVHEVPSSGIEALYRRALTLVTGRVRTELEVFGFFSKGRFNMVSFEHSASPPVAEGRLAEVNKFINGLRFVFERNVLDSGPAGSYAPDEATLRDDVERAVRKQLPRDTSPDARRLAVDRATEAQRRAGPRIDLREDGMYVRVDLVAEVPGKSDLSEVEWSGTWSLGKNGMLSLETKERNGQDLAATEQEQMFRLVRYSPSGAFPFTLESGVGLQMARASATAATTDAPSRPPAPGPVAPLPSGAFTAKAVVLHPVYFERAWQVVPVADRPVVLEALRAPLLATVRDVFPPEQVDLAITGVVDQKRTVLVGIAVVPGDGAKGLERLRAAASEKGWTVRELGSSSHWLVATGEPVLRAAVVALQVARVSNHLAKQAEEAFGAGDVVRAAMFSDAAVSLDASDAQTRRSIGMAMFRQASQAKDAARMDEGLGHLRKALSKEATRKLAVLDEALTQADLGLALLLRATGGSVYARDLLKSAVAVITRQDMLASARYNLACAHARLGELEAGHHHLWWALDADRTEGALSGWRDDPDLENLKQDEIAWQVLSEKFPPREAAK